MRVLAITGRRAEEQVRAAVASSRPKVDVLVLDVEIAAFITPQMLLAANPRGYDLILIPGAITADFSHVESALSTQIRLGPKHAADLKSVIPHLEEIELSSTIPACVLLAGKLFQEAKAALKEIEARAAASFTIKGIKIGKESRMKVLAEVVDSTLLLEEELTRRIHYFQAQGADMIDLGIPLDAQPEDVAKTVETARRATYLPLSVDTLQPGLIRAGLSAGVDLVLSLDGKNLPLVGKAVACAGVPAVVIPGRGSLMENIRIAQTMGIKVIADPVLNPPLQGLSTSLTDYLVFKLTYPGMPLFFGAGNVTELLDADSPGANGLLAALASELGASILFTPEYSDKAKGCVRELRCAAEMMALAKERRTPPKDLGVDLLILKEKRRRPAEPEISCQEPEKDHPYRMDPAGSFRIGLSGGRILVQGEKICLAGTSAKDLLNTLISRGAVTLLDHAGYLGRELAKAELALLLNRSYSQDDRF